MKALPIAKELLPKPNKIIYDSGSNPIEGGTITGKTKIPTHIEIQNPVRESTKTPANIKKPSRLPSFPQ